jgi:hypothetical protein
MNEFAYIGFCVRTGTPMIHGATKAAAWRQLIERRLTHIGLQLPPSIIQIYIESISHRLKVVYCGDGGPIMWERKTPMIFVKPVKDVTPAQAAPQNIAAE